ncbi:ABC transporter ATP-binding protein [Saccharopolyspora pogona]|uniref:ABC transporter ATP-binding protein n=2 Tax=Saccharopolyspora TaxID=1835 RepID=UPI0021DF4D17|nr:ATP-binding cassette domain-containing protein [Saccharopolyspora pogona]
MHAGEIVGLVGESGSGKSTCASLVLALTRLDGGEVRLSGQPWTALRERDRRPARPRVQLISQDPLSSFDPRYSAGRIVRESLAGSGLGTAAQQERVVQVLRQVGLGEEYLDRYPRTMSGGQRQRVAIARALAPEPDIIICDEPVSALDVSIQAQVLDLLSEVRARLGTSLLFISHDIGVIHHLCDRVLVIKDGRIVEQGPVEEVFLEPEHWYTRQLMAAVPRIGTVLGEPTEQHG